MADVRLVERRSGSVRHCVRRERGFLSLADLGKIDIAAGRDGNIADIGPVPAAFEFAETIMNEFFYRGFSLNPDGKSFLTSVLRVKTQVYLVDYFDQPTRLADQLWRRR